MRSFLSRLFLAALLGVLLVPPAALAAPAPEHGDRTIYEYTVKRGDTLWGIAQRFLKNPWEWPAIWEKNPYVTNPDLIYPGDKLLFETGAHGTVRLSVVRSQPRMEAGPLPTVRQELVMKFLRQPGVITSAAYHKLPWLAAAREKHTIFATGDVLYAKGLQGAPLGSRYAIVRLGPALKEPGTGQVLGHALADIGIVDVRRSGPTTEVAVTGAYSEIVLGDRLIPLPPAGEPHYFPSAPARPLSGAIIAAMGPEPELVPDQVVVIDRGAQAGLVPGNVLEVYAAEAPREDVMGGATVQLPDLRVGTVMVFRVFDRASFALIMGARRGIRVGDRVRSPAAGTARIDSLRLKPWVQEAD